MGKSDQKKTQNAITDETTRSQKESNDALSSTEGRVNQLTPQADSEKSDIWGGYSKLAANGGSAGNSQEDRDRLLNGRVGGGSGNPSGGGGGGGGTPGQPSYLDTWNELRGATGGFDPTRLANINKASGALYDTSHNYDDTDTSIKALHDAKNNYGATDTSIHGLQDLAATGGMHPGDEANISRDSLKSLEADGGYSADARANLRSRSNSAVASTYGNLQDNLNRNRLVQGQVGPGMTAAGFKLARQGAQDIGANTRDTEIGINSAVNANKLAAGSKLGDLALGTQTLKNNTSLAGYTNAGNLDIGKNAGINDANTNAGKLDLTKQSQIDAAKASAAGIDQGTQSLINNTRLSAASGQSGDTLGRMSIGASSAANAAALDAANERFLISEGDQKQQAGLGGMLNTYQAAPTELMHDQDTLRGYRQDASNQQRGLIGDRTAASYIPGIGSTIGAGFDVAGKALGAASGISGGLSGLGGMFKPKVANPATGPTSSYWGR